MIDADLAITILLCFEVVLVALGGGYIVRYELRRDAADALAGERVGGRSR